MLVALGDGGAWGSACGHSPRARLTSAAACPRYRTTPGNHLGEAWRWKPKSCLESASPTAGRCESRWDAPLMLRGIGSQGSVPGLECESCK